MEWLIGAAAGLLGGNAVGLAPQSNGLGGVGNSIAGGLGGAAGGSIVQGLVVSGVGFGAVAGQLVGGGAAGGLATLLVGFLKLRFGSGSASAAS